MQCGVFILLPLRWRDGGHFRLIASFCIRPAAVAALDVACEECVVAGERLLGAS